MCEDVFGTYKSKSGDYEPIVLPEIKTLVVKFADFDGARMGPCNRGPDFDDEEPDWTNIRLALIQLVSKDPPMYQSALIHAVEQFENLECNGGCHTLTRTDFVQQKVLRFPYYLVFYETHPHIPNTITAPTTKDAYQVLLHDGTTVITDQWQTLEEIVEGSTWKSAACGARLSTSVLQAEQTGLPSFATGCVEGPGSLHTVAQWTLDHPGSECLLWDRETKTGTKLVFADILELEDYEPSMIEEIIPEGWEMDWDTAELVRV
jgi:hypothetical protein